MQATAQRNESVTAPAPASDAATRGAPAPTPDRDDLYFVTSADAGAVARIDDPVLLAAAPPWLGALVVMFWLSLVIGSALRRTLLRHSGPDYPHADDTDPLAPRVRVHARSGIRAHLRPAPVRALRRGRH